MEINDTIKLSDGRRGKILATPSGFLSNGAYELEVTKDDGEMERIWVKEEQMLYVIDTQWEDNLNNYFEIIYGEDGIHMIPKNMEVINVLDESEEVRTIEFDIGGGEKHKKVTFHVGDTEIWSTSNPKPEPKEEPKKINLL